MRLTVKSIDANGGASKQRSFSTMSELGAALDLLEYWTAKHPLNETTLRDNQRGTVTVVD